MPLYGDSDEEYTRCHDCGEWDDKHRPYCLTGLKQAYVEGCIEIAEFEAGLDKAFQYASKALI